MFYTTPKGVDDVVAFCENALTLSNFEHPKNKLVTLHGQAKWVISKINHLSNWIKMFGEVTDEPIKIPLTEGVLMRIEDIKEILEHYDVQ